MDAKLCPPVRWMDVSFFRSEAPTEEVYKMKPVISLVIKVLTFERGISSGGTIR